MVNFSSLPKKLTLQFTITYPNGNTDLQKLSVKVSDEITIGRSSQARLRIKDEAIGRIHLKVKIIDNQKIQIIDLNSKNGTFVGDTRLAPDIPFDFDTFFMPVQLSKVISIMFELIAE